MLHVPVVFASCSWFLFLNIVKLVVLSKMATIHDVFRIQIYQEFVYGNKKWWLLIFYILIVQLIMMNNHVLYIVSLTFSKYLRLEIEPFCLSCKKDKWKVVNVQDDILFCQWLHTLLTRRFRSFFVYWNIVKSVTMYLDICV